MAEIIVTPSDEPNPESAAYIIKKYRDKVRSPMTAIRAKCIECSNGYLVEVRECKVTKCALHAFRMGHNPYHAKAVAAAAARERDAEGGDVADDGSNEEAGDVE